MRSDRFLTPVSIAVLAALVLTVAIYIWSPATFPDSRLVLGGGLEVIALLAYAAIRAVRHDMKTQRVLRAVSEQMRLAADAAGIGFWSRDLATEKEEWDDNMFRIYGVSREQFDGRWESFLHPDDRERACEEAQRAIDEGRPGEYRFRIVRPDGVIRHVRALSNVLRDSSGRAVLDLGIDIDITREVETDEALAAARERERHSEQAHRRELEEKLKTSLNAAAVAHEINQPLSRVLVRSKLVLEAATDLDRDTLAAIVADAERVVVVIQKMKVLLRNVETVQREVDLADIVTGAMHQVKRPLRDAGVVVTRGGVQRGCVMLGDDVQLQMIVTNLVNNAIEAIVHGGGDRREIAVEHHGHDDEVELVVGDSGPGWPGGSIDDVLLQTTKPDGAGIGLYVVKTAVENHRGRMTVGRSPLGGAEFRIRFPRIAAS